MLDIIEMHPHQADYVELLHITDTHIFADANDRFDDVDTETSLRSVLDCAFTHEADIEAVLPSQMVLEMFYASSKDGREIRTDEFK